jgi:hypothetical protein
MIRWFSIFFKLNCQLFIGGHKMIGLCYHPIEVILEEESTATSPFKNDVVFKITIQCLP